MIPDRAFDTFFLSVWLESRSGALMAHDHLFTLHFTRNIIVYFNLFSPISSFVN